MSYDENRISDLIDGGIQHKNELIESLREKSIIKGFIEVTVHSNISNNNRKVLLNFYNHEFIDDGDSCIIGSVFDSQYVLKTKESYLEVKQLIKQATEL